MREVVIAGRYRLLELVGRGGMGQVWRARDEELQREVAVKQVVPPNWLAESDRDELRARSLREARTAARLNHPNVVRVYDVVRVQGEPWLIMEYVPSRSLQEIIESDGPLAPRRAAEIGLAVLAGLRAAHDAGVLHRDVKPGNVLLARDGRVLLTDFGLAVFEGGDGAMTRPGLVLGSPQYVAPERAADGVSSVEADMWSLGATLHAAVEGRSPYARSTAMATLAALATRPPDPAPHAGPLAPVLVGLLRRDPRNRLGHDHTARLLTAAVTPEARPPARAAAAPHPPVPSTATPPDRPPAARPPTTTAGPKAAGTDRPAAAPERPADRTGEPSDGDDAVRPGPGVTYPTLMPPAAAARAWSRAAKRSEWAPPVEDDNDPPSGRSDPAERRADESEPAEAEPAPRPAPAVPDRPTPISLGPTVLTSFVDGGSPNRPDSSAARADTISPVHTIGPGSAPVSRPAPVTHSGALDSGAVRGGLPRVGTTYHGGSGTARGPDDDRLVDGRTLRRWGLAVGATLLAVVVGVGTALAVTDSHDEGLPGSVTPSETPRATGPQVPAGPGVLSPPFPCVGPDVTGTPVRRGPRPADPAVNVPPGWVWPADTGGFRIALPTGWLRLRLGDTTCFQDPITRRILGVEPYLDLGGDPVGQLRSSERDLTSAGRLPEYEKIRLSTDGNGARWECRWTDPNGERMRAVRVLPGEQAGWTLGWTTTDADWADAADQFALIRASLTTVRPTRTAG
ncbi:protein kinase domain-containing protein [Micromonospora sp. DT31]|uniref:serine/threonine-protein kinase n=1 Tax=Micromonospora sp. DT31 TaxID=3393434 RepID=UPI003CED6E68